MLVLPHVGIAPPAVSALDRSADLRLVALASMLPDLVDKPLELMAARFMNGESRLVGHSLTGLAAFALVAALCWRRAALPLVLAYATHLALDSLWEGPPDVVFWPWLAAIPEAPF